MTRFLVSLTSEFIAFSHPWLSDVASKLYKNVKISHKYYVMTACHQLKLFIIIWRVSLVEWRGVKALKTDTSRIYDRINWGHLRAVVLRLGFDEKWAGWIMICVDSVKYKSLINHEIDGKTPEEGTNRRWPFISLLVYLMPKLLKNAF